MDIERFSRLLEVYGGQAEAWPDEERAAALELLQCDAGAGRFLDEARALDRWLDCWAVAPTTGAHGILASLPPRHPVDRLLTRLLPRTPRELWRPALAASLTLGLGAALGAGLSPGTGPTQWETQERYLLMVTAPEEIR